MTAAFLTLLIATPLLAIIIGKRLRDIRCSYPLAEQQQAEREIAAEWLGAEFAGWVDPIHAQPNHTMTERNNG